MHESGRHLRARVAGELFVGPAADVGVPPSVTEDTENFSVRVTTIGAASRVVVGIADGASSTSLSRASRITITTRPMAKLCLGAPHRALSPSVGPRLRSPFARTAVESEEALHRDHRQARCSNRGQSPPR